MAERLSKLCRNLARRQPRYLHDLDLDLAWSPQRACVAQVTTISRRQFHRTAPSRQKVSQQPEKSTGLGQKFLAIASSLLPSRVVQPYQIFGATETIYKACAAPAAYKIAPELRKKEAVPLAKDGQEIGVGGGVWHNDFGLLPTFSTWSQVTMLHLYLVVVRLRCLDRDQWLAWQNQLVNHFFLHAEDMMEMNHGMSSRMIRQRHLKDLFQAWRGLVLAYDEGLIKGDAAMASAIWRNMFRSDENVDMRHVAAVVRWMNSILSRLDGLLDPALLYHGASVFKLQPNAELRAVDEPASLDDIDTNRVIESKPKKPES